MSVLKEISEFHNIFKFVLLGLAVLMPFWYLDIHLFSEWVTIKYSIILPIVISFCLSVGWLLGISFVSTGFSKQEKQDNLWIQTILVAVISIGFASYIGFIFKPTLFWFVSYSYGGIIVAYILSKFNW